MFDSIEEAIEDLREGKAVIVVDDENRENEGDFVALGEKATPEMINFMATEGRGLICAPITKEKADQLQLNMMADVNTDSHGTHLPSVSTMWKQRLGLVQASGLNPLCA